MSSPNYRSLLKKVATIENHLDDLKLMVVQMSKPSRKQRRNLRKKERHVRPTVRASVKNGNTFAQRILSVMGSDVLGINDVIDRLEAKGLAPESKDLRNYVSFTLCETPQFFERVSRGKYRRHAQTEQEPKPEVTVVMGSGGLRDPRGRVVSLRQVFATLSPDVLARRNAQEVWGILKAREYSYGGRRTPVLAIQQALDRLPVKTPSGDKNSMDRVLEALSQ